MQSVKKNIIVGITGASGAIYARELLFKLKSEAFNVGYVAVVLTENAKLVYKYELDEDFSCDSSFQVYSNNDFFAPFASGSSVYNTMIICPCSMGSLGRIANGISNDLLTRAADVILKERGKLVLVTRESPLSLIHINNMKLVTEAGGIICPANPSFYFKPEGIHDIVSNTVTRAISVAGIEIDSLHWGDYI